MTDVQEIRKPAGLRVVLLYTLYYNTIQFNTMPIQQLSVDRTNEGFRSPRTLETHMRLLNFLDSLYITQNMLYSFPSMLKQTRERAWRLCARLQPTDVVRDTPPTEIYLTIACDTRNMENPATLLPP